MFDKSIACIENFIKQTKENYIKKIRVSRRRRNYSHQKALKRIRIYKRSIILTKGVKGILCLLAGQNGIKNKVSHWQLLSMWNNKI